MAYYPSPTNATIGLGAFISYMQTALSTQSAMFGGNAIGLLVLIPLWFIIFFPMARFNPVAAWTVASFICWLVSMVLMALQYVNEAAFGLFLVFWIAGAIAYFLQTRQ